MDRPPLVILVTGVSGVGKTTVGRMLADRLGVPFVDGDDLHPESNRRRMESGTPLTDRDRQPWLDAVRGEIGRALDADEGLVVACSALKRAYRERLVRPGEPVRIVHLTGSKDLIAERMRARAGHFMPVGLLDSQFRDLEAPRDALALDVRRPPAALVDEVIASLNAERG